MVRGGRMGRVSRAIFVVSGERAKACNVGGLNVHILHERCYD
jgi:hypothetical protein